MGKDLLQTMLSQIDSSNMGQLADVCAAVTSAKGEQLQEVLEQLNIVERQRKSLVLLKNELESVKTARRINREIESKVTQQQQKYFLNEQLKSIKKELGLETDEKEMLIEKFRARLEKLTVPEEVMKTINEELTKLSSTEPASTEFAVTRNYLDWLTLLPWGVRSADNLSLSHASNVLAEDHYGLKDLKERILEFIAV